MKRLYTLMLSAAVAAAASAAIPVSKAPAKLATTAATEVVSPLVGGLNFRAEGPQQTIAEALTAKTSRTQQTHLEGGKLQRVAKAPRKADGTGSKFDGTYTLIAGEWYFESQSQSSVPVEVELTVEDGVAVITNDEYLVSDVHALLDEEKGEMTFVNYFVDTTTQHAISFMPFIYENGINFASYTITWNEETQSFDIPEEHGISWAAWDIADIEDAKAFNTATILGYYDVFDIEGLAKNETGGEEPEEPETWTSLGMGEWYEGLLTIFSDVDDGQHWSVEIEESDKTPGVYRMKPYAVEGNPISVILGGRLDTTTEVVVNATNPDKVYTVGRFAPFNLRIFSGINAENNFNGDAYGTMTDKVISFPARSFAYSSNGTSWSYVSKEGFKIALPGAVVKDYTLKAVTDHICADEVNTVNLTVGADIAAIKAQVVKGKYDTSYGSNPNIVAANGTDIEISDSFSYTNPEENGIYSIMVVGLDADGKVVAATTAYQVVNNENDADWEVVPNVKAIWTEGFLSGIFSDVDPEEFEVVLEQNVNTPGRFRFEAPYAQHSINWPVAEHSHKHYVYINATNPEKAYVEASALGITSSNFGSLYGYSFPGLYAGTATFDQLDATAFGTFADGKISTPAVASFNKAPNTGNYTATFELTIDTIAGSGTEWVSLGKGTWTDGFFTDETWAILTEGQNNSWEVEIEESTVTPGIYRILPYVEGTPMAEIVEEADTENYFIVNATNPDSVYVEGHWTPFDYAEFYQNCPEGDEYFDPDYDITSYGKMVDGEIFFPVSSFTELYEYMPYEANADGILMITMPGQTAKVYTLNANIGLCGGDGKANVNYTAGADVVALRTITAPGYFDYVEDMEAVNGVSIVDVAIDAAVVPQVANALGINTTFVQALDANGNVRRQYRANHFNPYAFTGWKNVEGKVAKFTDCIFTERDEDTEAEGVERPLEESETVPGLYRIINPYRDHEYLNRNHWNHNHCLYIDATDPDFVMIIPSATGLNDDNLGDAFITDYGYYYHVVAGYDKEEVAGYGGTYDAETGVIEFPMIAVGFSNFNKSRLMPAMYMDPEETIVKGGSLKIEIADDDKDGISEITSDDETDAVYYNIRGQRIARPTVPGLYIRNNAKVYVK